MAFDPTKYKAPEAKPLPVILLLDVSGSMRGDKIDRLYGAVNDMIQAFIEEQQKETVINIAIITFGTEIKLHTPYTPISAFKGKSIARFEANGMTPLGTALTMAKDMIEDRGTTPSKAYRPAVILVSDGHPNDSWEHPLETFIRDGRSSKCQRFAIPIGKEADQTVLERFTGMKENIFYAENASDITDAFKKVTMSVSIRSKSQNPNVVPVASNVNYDNPQQPVDTQSVPDDDYDDDYDNSF